MEGRKHSRLLPLSPLAIKTKTSPNASSDWLIFRILLNCYGFDKMEEISRYWSAARNNEWLSHFRFCIYESGDFRERKLNKNEKPLSVQSQWSSNSHYHRFILRRATRSVSNQVEWRWGRGGDPWLSLTCWRMFLCFSFLRRPVWMTMTGNC